MAANVWKKATIANAASLSGAVDLQDYRVVAVIYPSGWDAASMTFQASADRSTYNNVYDGDGNELTLPSRSAAGYVGLTAIQQLALIGVMNLKVRSGTSGSAVAQSGAVDVILVLEPL